MYELMYKPTLKLEYEPIDEPADGSRLIPMHEPTEEYGCG